MKWKASFSPPSLRSNFFSPRIVRTSWSRLISVLVGHSGKLHGDADLVLGLGDVHLGIDEVGHFLTSGRIVGGGIGVPVPEIGQSLETEFSRPERACAST